MSAYQADNLIEDSSIIPLSGLVNTCSNEPYADEDHVVNYVCTVSTSMMMNHVMDCDAKGVVYRVGVRHCRGNIPRPIDAERIDCTITVSEEVRRGLQEMGRRSSALPVNWERIDLYGVICRLSMGIAHYSVWGGLTAAELRGGGAVSCHSLMSVTSPIAADSGSVFVSTKILNHANPNIMAALVNAISGEGGTMYTDLLGVNGAGITQIPNAADSGLAQGCHEALRVIGGMYRACNKTSLFALAVTEGWHKIKSLHGHTDEGAYVRTVFRQGEAGVPYGAISIDTVPDCAIPTPPRSVSGFRSVYDGVGIATGAAVALADPMVDFEGRDYPTVLASEEGIDQDPGTNNAGDDEDAAGLSTQWAERCGAWASLYAQALNKIFVGTGGEKEVCRRLTAKANALAGTVDRHLRVKCALAFWFVEPTGGCPVTGYEFPAVVARHGPLATRNVPAEIPALDGAAILTDKSDTYRSTIQVDMRFLRRHGLFIHLTTHARNGMSNMTLDSAVVDHLALVGGRGDISERMARGDGLHTYQWGRNHSALVGAGELISLSRTNLITLHHCRMLGPGPRMRMNHLPTSLEAIERDVYVSVSALSGADPVARLAEPNTRIARARCTAAVALMLAADRGRTPSAYSVQRVIPSLMDPGPLPSAATGAVRLRTNPPPHRDPGRIDANAPTVDAADIVSAAGAADGGGTVNGLAAPVMIEQARNKGPRVPQAGGHGGMPHVPGGAHGAPPPPGPYGDPDLRVPAAAPFGPPGGPGGGAGGGRGPAGGIGGADAGSGVGAGPDVNVAGPGANA